MEKNEWKPTIETESAIREDYANAVNFLETGTIENGGFFRARWVALSTIERAWNSQHYMLAAEATTQLFRIDARIAIEHPDAEIRKKHAELADQEILEACNIAVLYGEEGNNPGLRISAAAYAKKLRDEGEFLKAITFYELAIV